MGGAVSNHEDDTWSVPKRYVACRPPSEPVEVDALVAAVESVERIAHPDAPAGEGDLLRGNAVGEDRGACGAAQSLMEERFTCAGRDGAARDAENDDRAGDCECRRDQP